MTNIQELKASAYDLISQIEWAQNQLRKTNEEIAKLLQEIKESQNVDDNGHTEYPVIN